ncbi:MAG: transposase [Candidatus Shapirobacteria bacterium]
MINIDNPEKFADKYKLKSPRLLNWDYSSSGHYFITIKTLNNNKFFGKIINQKMALSRIGIITKNELLKTFEIRQNIRLDEWIIMPDHIHLIIEIKKYHSVETHCVRLNNKNKCLNIGNEYLNKNNIDLSTRDAHSASLQKMNIKSNQIIPNVIKLFKSSVKSICNQNNLFFAWQPRFYDEIIKSEAELNNIREYIKNNI